MTSPDHHFRIDPLVVFKLGEELITDEVQALLELIKNAYDADASYVAVRIDTENFPADSLLAATPDRPGYIEVVDDGTGLDEDSIRDGWLLIARSKKLDFKKAGKLTGKKRTPLGDKGLGRLGAQRLGWGLQLATKTEKSKNETVLAFSWLDFFTAESLDQVEIHQASRATKRSKGTTLTVSELNDIDAWRGKAIPALQRELSQVISPYEGVSEFSISVTADGAPVDLQSLNREVRETAQLQYEIDFDGDRLLIEGRATLAFFRPSGKARQAFADHVEADGGMAFFSHLVASSGAAGFSFKRGKGKWFVTFKRTRLLSDLQPSSRSDTDHPNPGPFHAEVDSFDLGSGNDETTEVFGTLGQYRDFIKDLAGIRVYRDGFAVRVDKDWLKLGAQWTSAPSYYGLKPDTTTGYVAISSRDNPKLIEKTDREGFTDTPEFRAFRELMGDFIGFTTEVQEKLRRDFNSYFKELLAEQSDVSPADDPSKVAESIGQTLSEAVEVKAAVAAARSAVQSATEASNAAVGSVDDVSSDLVARSEKVAKRISDAMAEAEVALTTIDEYMVRLDTAKARTELLLEEISQLHEQVAQGVEAMSLGLTAEALSHELFNVADGLASRTQQIFKRLDDGSIKDGDVRGYFEFVRATVGSLRKELGHFSPSLRYVRDRRETIQIGDFVEDIAAYFESRASKTPIKATVSGGSSSFNVRSSRGRLTQVLDNLFLNSEYWMEAASVSNPEISIGLKRPVIAFSDNGPGVEASVEETLFDPFVTRKPRGEGRGLGLFVVRQMLESEGCSIALGPKRNENGRRFQFLINLESILAE